MTTIYHRNQVDDTLVEKVKEALDSEENIKVSFDVTGRTRHMQLSYQLEKALPQYKFIIGYNYVCKLSL